MKLETPDITQENIAKIEALFPSCVTESTDSEGRLKKVIDFDKLKLELGDAIVDGKKERYQFTWPMKSVASALANTPTDKTLRPDLDSSKDFWNTENLYIEGDNLEVLKVLRETYLGKVKMIYIDPPYNTGKDFVYKDRRYLSQKEMDELEGKYDAYGNIYRTNTEANGRFHTDWLNMIYPRLKVARDLLTDDGVIFISMDDSEIENLTKVCNEIFGEQNFEGHIHWRRRHNQPNDKTKMIGLVAENILSYAKDSKYLKKVGVGKIPITAEFNNPDNDPKGDWASKPWKVGSDQSGSRYIITTPKGQQLDEEWMGDENTYKEYVKEGRIYFPKKGDGYPRKKYYKFEREEEGQCATNWWPHNQFGHNQGANDLMTELFGEKNIFSNPKPIELIKGLCQIGNLKNNDLILDFFSGSASSAHALMLLNLAEESHCKFILVQLPEVTDEKSEAYKAGYKNICEIGEERIRRAGEKIKEDYGEKAKDLDVGFRVLKLDSSNMKDVKINPSALPGLNLDELTDNIKEDRDDLDLLFQVMLHNNIPLSAKIEKENFNGHVVYNVGEDDLIAVFDRTIDEDTLVEIAKKEPLKFVMREPISQKSSDLNPDNIIDNFEQKFELYSPNTIRRIL